MAARKERQRLEFLWDASPSLGPESGATGGGGGGNACMPCMFVRVNTATTLYPDMWTRRRARTHARKREREAPLIRAHTRPYSPNETTHQSRLSSHTHTHSHALHLPIDCTPPPTHTCTPKPSSRASSQAGTTAPRRVSASTCTATTWNPSTTTPTSSGKTSRQERAFPPSLPPSLARLFVCFGVGLLEGREETSMDMMKCKAVDLHALSRARRHTNPNPRPHAPHTHTR